MSKHVHGDAWIREAGEASKLIEEIDNRMKDKNPEQRLRDSARWKLLELGPILDNPPAKPILTDQDLDRRWSMLSEIQLRTKAVALSLYALQFSTSPESLLTADTKETVEAISSHDKDHQKVIFSEEDHELLAPLVKRQSSSLSLKEWIWKACWVIFLVLAAAAVLVFILVIFCAVI